MKKRIKGYDLLLFGRDSANTTLLTNKEVAVLHHTETIDHFSFFQIDIHNKGNKNTLGDYLTHPALNRVIRLFLQHTAKQ